MVAWGELIMPVGVLINCCASLLGIIIGVLTSKFLKEHLKNQLRIIFGFCAIAIGIRSISLQGGNVTIAVLAILIGYIIGHTLKLELKACEMFSSLTKVFKVSGSDHVLSELVTALALFCCSGFAWYAVITEAISGNAALLHAKSVLDFFTAFVFAAAIGKRMFLIPFIQIAVLILVFFTAKVAAPFITPQSLETFSLCGGILTIITGAKVAKIKDIQVLNLLPSLFVSLIFATIL